MPLAMLGAFGTHIELIVLSGLNRSILGKRLDDGNSFVELGLGHGCGGQCMGSLMISWMLRLRDLYDGRVCAPTKKAKMASDLGYRGKLRHRIGLHLADPPSLTGLTGTSDTSATPVVTRAKEAFGDPGEPSARR